MFRSEVTDTQTGFRFSKSNWRTERFAFAYRLLLSLRLCPSGVWAKLLTSTDWLRDFSFSAFSSPPHAQSVRRCGVTNERSYSARKSLKRISFQLS